mmetsp:Transcript_15020/g.25531  ORF Transcript_15020/g.25531 Transcript_15020/m.25531 type:complete len:412 (-) Transcript_15020:1057-2292(-)
MRQELLQLIEQGLNKTYLSVKKLDTFFEKCWCLQEPHTFKDEEPRFFRFLYDDTKFILQNIDVPEHLVNFAKLIVFVKADDDPELMDILADRYNILVRSCSVVDMLTITVNFAHTLSPKSSDVFHITNQEIQARLRGEYKQMDYHLFVKAEHIFPIMETLLEYKQLHDGTKDEINEFISSKSSDFNYSILADLSMVFATKMDKKYQNLFFDTQLSKFAADLRFIGEKELYKILWSFIKSERLSVQSGGGDWILVRELLKERMKEMSPETLTKILVLTTVSKPESAENDPNDFWKTSESLLVRKMKEMEMDDLINLLWSALELNRGSPLFFEEIEKMIMRKVLKVTDEDLEQLISCLIRDDNPLSNQGFSKKFLAIILKAINERRDRFQIKTLVSIIWSLSKIDFELSDEVV